MDSSHERHVVLSNQSRGSGWGASEIDIFIFIVPIFCHLHRVYLKKTGLLLIFKCRKYYDKSFTEISFSPLNDMVFGSNCLNSLDTMAIELKHILNS